MPLVTFIHDGNSIDHTPASGPGNDVTAGDVVVQGDLIGIAKLDIPAGTLGALAVTGVFSFAVENFESWTIGLKAYWNSDDLWADTSDNGGAYKFLGKCVGLDAANSRVLVRLSQ